MSNEAREAVSELLIAHSSLLIQKFFSRWLVLYSFAKASLLETAGRFFC